MLSAGLCYSYESIDDWVRLEHVAPCLKSLTAIFSTHVYPRHLQGPRLPLDLRELLELVLSRHPGLLLSSAEGSEQQMSKSPPIRFLASILRYSNSLALDAQTSLASNRLDFVSPSGHKQPRSSVPSTLRVVFWLARSLTRTSSTLRVWEGPQEACRMGR